MKNIKLVSLFVLSIAFLILFTGCKSTKAYVQPYHPGKILLLPPRDVVQRGEAHEAGAGSGSMLAAHIKQAFMNKPFEIVETTNEAFNNTEKPNLDLAKAEAEKQGADFYLVVTLGEFLDAAPMTFRGDYVYMESAEMYDTKTGKKVWQLVSPIEATKSNVGDYRGLLNYFGNVIANSINEYVAR